MSPSFKGNNCILSTIGTQVAIKLHTIPGIEVVTSSGRVLKVTGQLLTASVDLPARALVANMKQFNGKSACITCLDEGECPPGQSLARYYPFRENSVLRSHNSVLHDAREATRGTEAVSDIT